MSRKLTTDEWIAKAKDKYGDKYDYSQVEYVGSKSKIKIVCPDHGLFNTTPSDHVKSKTGCPRCGEIRHKQNVRLLLPFAGVYGPFISKQNAIQQGLAYYFPGTQCSKGHIAVRHIDHSRCTVCHRNASNKHFSLLSEEQKKVYKIRNYKHWFARAKAKYGDKYDYRHVEYVDTLSKVKIICPDHGLFETTPQSHIKSRTGCHECGWLLENAGRRLSSISLYLKTGEIDSIKTQEKIDRIIHHYVDKGWTIQQIIKYEKSEHRNIKKLLIKHGVTVKTSAERNTKDIANRVFERLTAIELDVKTTREKGARYWLCRCSCGKEVVRSQGALLFGQAKSCGCYMRELISADKVINLVGQRFGSLVVDRDDGQRTKHGGMMWMCKCDCGNETLAESVHLRSGRRISCGCIGRGEDSVSAWLQGTFKSAEKLSFVYVYKLARYSHLTKVGIAVDHSHRASDIEYGELYDFLEVPRLHAYLIEQAVLQATASEWVCPEDLIEWRGQTEIRDMSATDVYEQVIYFHDQLMELGLEQFAINYVPTTPDQRNELEKRISY